MAKKKRSIPVYTVVYAVSGLLLLGLLLWEVYGFVVPPRFEGVASEEDRGNPLAIPQVLEDKNPDPDKAFFELNAQYGEMEFLPGLITDTLGYNGDYLGPVLHLRKGQEVEIQVNNRLTSPTTTHWHGLDVDGDNDGGPHQGILPGESWTANFSVDQPAATIWYHPHFHHLTGDQVYRGMAGLIYIEDEQSDDLAIPKTYGQNDIPIVIQDRNFRRDGSFHYNLANVGLVPGDTLLVNGTVDPYLEVKRELIRLRILNGSNFENYNLAFSDGRDFYFIASDGGFLEAPVKMDTLFLSPGERAEILVDLSQVPDEYLALVDGRDVILDLYLTGDLGDEAKIPSTLVTVPDLPLGENPTTRTFVLESHGIHGTINGKEFDMERIDERVPIGETELWVIRTTEGSRPRPGHPFHVHGAQFQVLSRDGNPPPPHESGFKDTIFVENGEEVVIKVVFHKEGLFMYHCHMLEHEEHGMMGQFIVE